VSKNWRRIPYCAVGSSFNLLGECPEAFNARWNLTDWKKGNEPTRHPRILFLADRINLADQAYNDFMSSLNSWAYVCLSGFTLMLVALYGLRRKSSPTQISARIFGVLRGAAIILFGIWINLGY
jgi:hypothetical protein